MKWSLFVISFESVYSVCLAVLLMHSYSLENTNEIQEAWKSTPEMIAAEGYPVESHYVTTSDGYILNIHRIPRGKSGKKNNRVAFFAHGLICSSWHAVLLGPKTSPGYIFADEGYDVWLLNARGNAYSRNHTTLNPDTDAEFWNFSWHEIGTFDVPAVIDYILNATGTDGVYYVGYPQGSTIFFVMTSVRPEYNAKIKAHIGLAPTTYMKHVKSPLLLTTAKWTNVWENFLNLFGLREFLPEQGIIGSIFRKFCSDYFGTTLCENFIFTLNGWNQRQYNASIIPLIFKNTPSGCSTYQVVHFNQQMLDGKFRQFDFGFDGNLEKYGKANPPEYDLSKVTVPVYLFHSRNDLIATMEDVERLYRELPISAVKILMEDSLWTHMDFILGIDAPQVVYRRALSIIDEVETRLMSCTFENHLNITGC